jgi:heat shock protein 4
LPRSSPTFRSLVSFGIKQRALGEAAKTQEISNFRNTVGSLKRLLGRTLHDVEIQQVEKRFTHVNLVEADGSVGVEVSGSNDFLSRSP